MVERAGRDLTLHVTPVNGRTIKEGGKRLPAHGYIGIEVADLTVHTSPFAAIPDSFTQIGRYVGDAVVAIGTVLTGRVPEPRSPGGQRQGGDQSRESRHSSRVHRRRRAHRRSGREYQSPRP